MNIEEYREVCQKNEQENYLLDKLIFRNISIYLTIIFIKLGIGANQATLLSLLASLGSLWFLMFNTQASLLAAAFLIFAYYLLDHVDGELARYYLKAGKLQPSLSGHYFDVLVHRYSSNLMVFFMGVGVYNLYGYEWAVLLGFAACIGISSFPNVIAAQVIAGKIANNKEIVQSNKMEKLLLDLEKKSSQISDVHHGTILQKLRKLIIETLFFPGHIVLLVLILIGDAFIGEFLLFSYLFNLRLAFLLIVTPLFLLKTMIQSVLWIHKFKSIA